MNHSYPSLLLIPTFIERQWASDLVDGLSADIRVELCGFGSIMAGIRAAQLIALYRPQRVWLVGIAGALVPQLDLGTAYEFHSVSCYGIGVGCGANFQTAAAMGWPQWSSPSISNEPQTISDTLQLAGSESSSKVDRRELLTVCASSANGAEVACRKRKFPKAQAEDMEGFAVAAACQLSQVSLRIIRGIANTAGDRDHRAWQSARAMRAAMELFSATMDDWKKL